MSHLVFPELPGTKTSTREYTGCNMVTHGSRCMGSRGWPCWTSKGREAPGPGEAQCSSVGEYQDREAGEG